VKTDTCPRCFRRVTARQEALQCDVCSLWLHRTCGSNLSQADYREITRQIQFGIPFDWVCSSCKEGVRAPIMESTRIDGVDVGVQ